MKKFYTDKDIEELHHSGVKLLKIDDNVVLTDLAYEKANRLGFRLISDGADKPPAAPVRPYLSEKQPPQPRETVGPVVAALGSQPVQPSAKSAALEERIRNAVIARLGNQVDAKLLDTIIQRTLKVTGIR